MEPDPSSDAFGVRSHHGSYLRVNDSAVDAAPHRAEWELFQIDTHENGKVSLKSCTFNAYLRINSDGTVDAVQRCTEWEEFDMITHS